MRCAAQPAVAYALVFGGGVYRSGDSGTTWHDANGGLPAANYFDLAADPSDPDSTWVIDSSGQGPTPLYHTQDGGAHWQALTAPKGSNLVAAARGGVIYAGGGEAVFRSADQARSWKSVTASLDPNAIALSIAVDTVDPNLLYAVIRGVFASGVYVTADGGGSWRGAQDAGSAYVLRTDPHQRGVVVGMTANGLLRSIDAGRSWHPLGPGGFPDFTVVDFSFGAGRPSDVLLLVSTVPTSVFEVDGRSGHAVLLPTDPGERSFPTAISAGGEDPGVVIVGEEAGVRRTVNAGGSWTDGSRGLAGLYAGPVAVRGPSSFLAGNMRTEDAGIHWAPFLPGQLVLDLAVDSRRPSTVYAATGGAPDIVWRSTDGGRTWRPAASGLPSTSIAASLAVDAQHQGTLYLATEDENLDGQLFRSVDAGASWQPIEVRVFDPFNVTLDSGDPDCVYVATGGSIASSCDEGRTWTTLLDTGGFTNVAVAPSDALWIYAAQTQQFPSPSALWRSRDGGLTFDTSPLPCDPLATVVLQVDARAPDVVYVAAFGAGGGLWRRQGDGPWEDLSLGLPNRDVPALVFDARFQPRLVASTSAGVRVLFSRSQP